MKKIAKALVTKVHNINPKAQVIKNWDKNPQMVIDHVNSYYINIGKKFLNDPFKWIDINRFK